MYWNQIVSTLEVVNHAFVYFAVVWPLAQSSECRWVVSAQGKPEEVFSQGMSIICEISSLLLLSMHHRNALMISFISSVSSEMEQIWERSVMWRAALWVTIAKLVRKWQFPTASSWIMSSSKMGVLPLLYHAIGQGRIKLSPSDFPLSSLQKVYV